MNWPNLKEVDASRHASLAERHLVPLAEAIAAGQSGRHGRRSFTHVNPSTGAEQAEVGLAAAGDVDDAVAAARAALPRWRGMRVDERRNALLRLAGLVRREAATLGELVMLESGYPRTMAGGLPHRAADYLEYYAGWADKIEGSTIPLFPEQGFDYTLAEPYGSVGMISTWNGGISGACRKAGAALAAGNTVVYKAMELAPFAATVLERLALEAGLPEGAIKVVVGDAETGGALVDHPDIAKISFTGGGAAARSIMANAAKNLTPCVFELGGKSAALVFDDVDVEKIAQFSARASMGLAGQGCLLPTRLLVHESIHDKLMTALVATARDLPIGDPLDPTTEVGPMVSSREYGRVLGMIERARSGGAGDIALGGHRLDLSDGYFIEPTIVDRPAGDAEILTQEVFGPVLCVQTFSSEDEAIAMANATDYGLAGYVHTRDVGRAHRVAAQLEAGYISINGLARLPASTPFGGYGHSGMGKEGGQAGLQEFLRIKNVFVDLS